MTVRIKRQAPNGSLIDAVREACNVDLALCYQCKKCSSGCPVAKVSRSSPSEIVRSLQLGAGDEILASDIIWLCLSCETCYSRCPMKINVAAVMDALRALAQARRAPGPKGDMPAFNRIFLNMVKRFGRAYDLPTIALYKLRTGNLVQDVEKLPAMLKKGKIAVLPPSGGDKQAVERVFRTRRAGRTEK